MSVAIRSLLVPGVALAAAGAVALGPLVPAPVAPYGTSSTVQLETVSIENIQLAGIGQDIYYAVTPWVQWAVSSVSYGTALIPFIGPPIADQININYFGGIQQIVEATVNYLAAVVQNPFNFIGATTQYGSTLYAIGYNWISAEAAFFGLPVLPPLPPLAAKSGSRSPAVAATPTPARAAAARKDRSAAVSRKPPVVASAQTAEAHAVGAPAPQPVAKASRTAATKAAKRGR